MTKNIEITIENKIARTDFTEVVSFNSVYRLQFHFDAEWNDFPDRVAVVSWEGGSSEKFFQGDECDMPQINSRFSEIVYVGVYSIKDDKRIASSLIPISCLPGAFEAPKAKEVESLHDQILDFVNRHANDPNQGALSAGNKRYDGTTDVNLTASDFNLASVALTGSYSDLKNQPTIPSVPSWAMQSKKPNYAWEEIEEKPELLTVDKDETVTGRKNFYNAFGVSVQNPTTGETASLNGDYLSIGLGHKEASDENPKQYLRLASNGITLIEDLGGQSGGLKFFQFPAKSGTFALSEDVPNVPSWALSQSKPLYSWGEISGKPTNFVTTDGDQTIAGAKYFGGMDCQFDNPLILGNYLNGRIVFYPKDTPYGPSTNSNPGLVYYKPNSNSKATYLLPDPSKYSSAQLAVTADIPPVLSAYPVGAVYLSFSNTSPASLFGGTWSQITGKFLYCANGTGTGGSNTVTLTLDQIPAHAHSVVDSDRFRSTNNINQSRVGRGWSSASDKIGGITFSAEVKDVNVGATLGTDNAGGGKSFNNMPAYQEVYAWRRTE